MKGVHLAKAKGLVRDGRVDGGLCEPSMFSTCDLKWGKAIA